MLQDFILLYVSTCRFQWPPGLRSKAWVCGRSLAGIVGSNPAGDMDVPAVSVVCCQVEVSADYSSRGFLRSVVCLSVMMNPR